MKEIIAKDNFAFFFLKGSNRKNEFLEFLLEQLRNKIKCV